MREAKRSAEKLSDRACVRVAEVTEWWRALGPAERRDLCRDAGRPPARVVARFVEADEDLHGSDGDDFYEYLVNHELTLDDGRTFHICSAHPEARAVVAAGRIPATFRCPRGEAVCPMRTLLDRGPGHDVQLSLVRRCR